MPLDDPVPSLVQKLLSSLAVLGAAVALPLFAAVGAPDGDPFPHSVPGTPAQH